MSTKLERPRMYGSDAVSPRELSSYLYRLSGQLELALSELERQIGEVRAETVKKDDIGKLSTRVESIGNEVNSLRDAVDKLS